MVLLLSASSTRSGACFTLYSPVRCGVCLFHSHFAWDGTFHYRMLWEELGWNQQKSDELLLPVIQRVNKRGAAAAVNAQSNLDAYFGNSIGSVGGSAVPRKRQAYTSKRLQKVVTDYREEQRERSRTTAGRGASTPLDPGGSGDQYTEGLDGSEDLLAELGEDLDVDGSDDHGERDPRSGSLTRAGNTSKSTTRAKTTVPAKRKAAGQKRKTRKSRRIPRPRPSRRSGRSGTNDSDGYDDDEYPNADEVAPVPARPRPKPVRKKANTGVDAGSRTADQERDG
jgi:DNA excision repair protein ERCC-5